MRIHSLTSKEILKALGIGIVTSLLLSTVMVPAIKSGISPLPKPLSLAFATTLFGRKLPMPVGLLFHVAYVTFWSMAYVALFWNRLTFMRALWLALVLWGLVLVFFFPFVGWGFLGLAITPKLILASFVPHFLFAFFLWGLCKLGFKKRQSIQQ
ncbi:MAG: hypothetical protein BRC40_00605 [Cyanobacteria bacterium QH_8_48_120]|jgi:hypothetical protein|nr:MAG: hypothetical protein BRC34_17545 [Cyanobacteria bacterium QH_1_48_107]PSO58359.1 MAG: hypothetical protein BRC39_13180 [Cyanobacteria bacterium QH_7_48_89]PSO58541.1 MAG: hypothetical protein BRC36_17860 [Cyanobacteria bacterium QH_2_48_84]PSO60159.1 MAG: hypothetical protein BRC35_02265 [Cyanobacteria bacterium QH_10_48_56]PSO65295.1 MAG: hypothetical protein BRC38_09305 [Cyanobacteria bacterium QH_6_48_35]PSO70545.1 MAG: hypothetical protein BRC37_15545 [Cyanobacteria bacterium QH_3_